MKSAKTETHGKRRQDAGPAPMDMVMTSKTNRVGSGGNQMMQNAKGPKSSNHPVMISESPKIIYTS
jgi:hypothetical protein